MAAKKFEKSYFDVLGLCCSSEVPLIENILKPLDGVKDVSVIVPSRTVIVVHDNLIISQLEILKALNQARMEANVRVYGEDNYKRKWPSPFSLACGLLLLLSLFKYIYGPFRWLALGAVAVGIFPIARKGLVSIQNFRLDVNILAIVAVIGTIVLKDYLEAGTIVFLFSIAEWLESRASRKATAVMSSLMAMAPQKAVIAETGEVVDVDEVKVDTIVAVKAGEIIPIDGIVVEGKCEVDEKTLTGESFPVAKQNESIVWAGTINLNGYISVKTTALAEDCVVAKMAKLVEEAQNNKSTTQRFIDKFAKYYTPGVFITAVGLVVIPAALRVDNKNHWFRLGLVVLVSACPCAIILSTPVATFCALSKAATSGLLIKGGDYLEILSKIKTMAFDKTGTITRGEFIVTDFQTLHNDITFNTLLYWVSSIESKSSHPMAVALVDYGRSHAIEPKPENVEEFQNFPGEGIHGKIDGKDIYIGNRKISQRAGCGTVPTLEGDAKEGQTIGYIYNGAIPAGIFSLSDACRTGVAEAIKELKSLGIKTAMLTGDSHAAAMHAQDQLGHALEAVHAELLPEDKARIITGFKKEGPTAMIGDGMNDAPALATADIGISMGISGSALATETGHVILMSNDIRKIPKAIRLARKTHRTVIENIILSITTKVAILALAIAGHPLVWAAVLADLGTCLLVIFNSMLLLRGTHKHGGKCCKSSTNISQHIHKNCSSSQICPSECKSSPFSPAHPKHQHCSSHKSHNTAKNISEPQKCSSQMCAPKCQSSPFISSSCEKEKYTDSAERPDGCIGTDGVCQEAKPCGNGSCNMVTHDMEYSCNSCLGPFVSTSCGENKCTNSMERQGGELHEVKHCDHGQCNIVAHDMGSDSTITHNHLSHGMEADGCIGTDGVCQEAKPCGNGSRNMVTHDLEYSCNSCLGPFVSSSCGENKCTNSMERQDGELHEVKHCDHGHCNIVAHDMGSDSTITHNHSSRGHTSSEQGLLQVTNKLGHCHMMHSAKNHVNDEDLRNVEENTNCDFHAENRVICCENKKSVTDFGGPLHASTNIDNVTSCGHGESMAMHSCMSLKKREYGGCCKSFRKECFGKHGHFGAANFGGGGLSEIITE